LYCQNNLLEQLNTKNWNWVIGFTITAQTNNLTCVGVDNLGYANTNWINTFDNFKFNKSSSFFIVSLSF